MEADILHRLNHDHLKPHAARVKVAHVPLIAACDRGKPKRKNDSNDAQARSQTGYL
jgi:hypothetical protein